MSVPAARVSTPPAAAITADNLPFIRPFMQSEARYKNRALYKQPENPGGCVKGRKPFKLAELCNVGKGVKRKVFKGRQFSENALTEKNMMNIPIQQRAEKPIMVLLIFPLTLGRIRENATASEVFETYTPKSSAMPFLS